MSTDDPLVDFLSSGPNLRFALRIASSIDLVRERLVERFFGQVEQAARAELGDRASAWSERKPRLERSMPRPYLEWKVNEEDQLFASAQLNGPRKEILYGVAWDDQRPEGSLVPRAARAVHSALQRAMAKGARASSWWLRSGVHQRGIDEACLSASEEDGLARTVGKELGRVMLAVESELVEANRKLERERGRKG